MSNIKRYSGATTSKINTLAALRESIRQIQSVHIGQVRSNWRQRQFPVVTVNDNSPTYAGDRSWLYQEDVFREHSVVSAKAWKYLTGWLFWTRQLGLGGYSIRYQELQGERKGAVWIIGERSQYSGEADALQKIKEMVLAEEASA